MIFRMLTVTNSTTVSRVETWWKLLKETTATLTQAVLSRNTTSPNTRTGPLMKKRHCDTQRGEYSTLDAAAEESPSTSKGRVSTSSESTFRLSPSRFASSEA